MESEDRKCRRFVFEPPATYPGWLARFALLSLGLSAAAQTPHPPPITSISVCSTTGPGGTGSCPAGTADTHQIVLAPDGSGNTINSYGNMVGISDEHQSVFPPGSLQGNSDYLFFVASRSAIGAPSTGVMVLSGGAGPDRNGQWTLDFAKADGYNAFPAGYGQIFVAPNSGNCPTVADGNPAHQDQTFDLRYAAPGSIVLDPSSGPGNLLMIYEGTNTCLGSTGGPDTGNFYSEVVIATSRDYGHSWPTYRAKTGFNFIPLPNDNSTQGPQAPTGALGSFVCMGNDCITPPSATYGRYPVLGPSVSISTAAATGKPLPSSMGDSEMSGFLDDAASGPASYVYAVYDYKPGTGALADPNASGADLMIARAPLNGGSAPLSFSKWNGQGFSAPGLGGYDSSIFPSGLFANCEGNSQLRYGASLSYVEDTQQYLLAFVCDSPGDPALGPNPGSPRGAAWFYSTNYSLSDPTQWTAPLEITGSWEQFDASGGCSNYKGFYPTLMSPGSKPGHLKSAGYIFYLWGCQTNNTPPPDRRYSSRAFTISNGCSYALSLGGQAFPAQGGSGVIQVSAATGCPWILSNLPAWLTLTSPASGTGNGSVAFTVAPNNGGDQWASLIIGGQTFTIEQAAGSITGLTSDGSLAQVVSAGTWESRLTAVNLGASAATARFAFTSDAGASLALPFTFPQTGAGPLLAPTLDRSLNPNAQVILDTTGPTTSATLQGWGQLSSNGGVSGFGIFNNPTYGWNAVVPLETRNAASYLLAFDNTAPLGTGLAIANLTAQAANVNIILRDDTGAQIQTAVIALPANGHTAFMLNQQYPATVTKRGTIEFDTPPGGQISVLGLRANSTTALTTLPVLANVTSSGGSITHVAYNGGFTSTFYIVNTGGAAAQFTLSFFDESGNPLSVPLTLPQTNSSTTTTALTQTLAAGALLVVQTQVQNGAPAVVGSAQLTTTGNISGFEVFRWLTYGQEASVPLETRNPPNSFVLVFDDTSQLTTGVAVANLANAPVNITVNLRDDSGVLLQTAVLPLGARGHTSFMLPANYATTGSVRGMAEFVMPTGGKISVIGLRAGPNGALTTIPVLIR